MSLSDFLEKKMLEGLGFEPTSCQVDLIKKLSEYILSSGASPLPGGKEIMIINGYAGTGKTSVLASLVKVLDQFERNSILLAPTGRAAKVLSGYTGKRAFTIHKHIYRQRSMSDGLGLFSLNINQNKDTIYIVDEASLISNESDGSSFGSGHLLDDLIQYVYSGDGNKLILTGDSAQLPPVGFDFSEALDHNSMKKYGPVHYTQLRSVVRQAKDSGILHNATILRNLIEKGSQIRPSFEIDGFSDVRRITGGDLIEQLESSFSKWGEDDTLVLCRSNKRANRYNSGIRSSVLFREERVGRGDKLMIVKNCYQFLEDAQNIGFIANGDVAELLKISNYEERYGLTFAEATLSFPDYDNLEIKAKIILDTLESETASLGSEQQKRLFAEIMEDYSHIKTKRKRIAAVREDRYFNALQVKFASAITCHKSQGGQWSAVFIDNPFWRDDISLDDLKWLYTAITRATDMIYFVNFNDSFFRKNNY
ncbi:MAG: AAA family ATPase [Bacteroidales bacterium]|jgi:exodeoxyribonuclease-5|nr:AAA family ATPase [Bacteroidales bacterium]